MTLERAHRATAVMGGRIGTSVATRAALVAALGAPSYDTPSADEKVTIGWIYKTPRGPAELRDYWWNSASEWSVAAANRKAAMWLCRFLRRQGIQASTLIYNAREIDGAIVIRRGP